MLTTAPSALFPLKRLGLNLIISGRVTTAAARPLSFLILNLLPAQHYIYFFDAIQQSTYPSSTMDSSIFLAVAMSNLCISILYD